MDLLPQFGNGFQSHLRTDPVRITYGYGDSSLHYRTCFSIQFTRRRTPKPVPPYGRYGCGLSVNAGPAMSTWIHGYWASPLESSVNRWRNFAAVIDPPS